MIGAGQRSGGSIDVCGCCCKYIIATTKLIESYAALLLVDQPLAEERQHFHDNLWR